MTHTSEQVKLTNTNINNGVDPARIQQNKPCFFVNWTDKNGENQYKFFQFRFEVEQLKNRLINEQ